MGLLVFMVIYTRAFKMTRLVLYSHLSWLGLFMFFGLLAITAIFRMAPEANVALAIIGNSGTSKQVSTASVIWKRSIIVLGILGVACTIVEGSSCLLRPILNYAQRFDDADRADVTCTASEPQIMHGAAAMHYSTKPTSAIAPAVEWRIGSMAIIQVFLAPTNFVVFFSPFQDAVSPYLTWGNLPWHLGVIDNFCDLHRS
ncbi:hypothetical protein BJ742DRAFT_902833 [Cladochytrium replicatum]|nr:hypothetical protein BJ742DRAFT_902833 [Cladochytrium replicatum]